MSEVQLDGAVDMHCHFGPESVIGVPHAVDALEAASEAADAGFAAIVLKSHDFPSNAVAGIVQQQVGGVKVVGSVCCDFCIGGLNPAAVETALRDGAGIVWLPTISSQQDVDNGVAAVLGLAGPGLQLLDEEGALVDPVEEILHLVDEYDAVAATGHTSTAEHYALAAEFGRRCRLVVTHAMNPGGGPRLSAAECKELAELGAFIELTASMCMGSHGPSVQQVFDAIQLIGPDRVVLATDYGWNAQLPHPAAGMESYVDALWRAGASEADLRQMACDNPARLLRLDS